jgi:hypothetical protein
LPRPLANSRYGRVRDGVLSSVAGVLARTTRPLWYAESIVLAARFQQWLAGAAWAAGSNRYRDRLSLWSREAEPRLRGKGATVLEFGVADGLATQWWADRDLEFAAWHGFDTFEGLPAPWQRAGVPVMSPGAFRPGDGTTAEPVVSGRIAYTWHKGLIEETFPGFPRPDTSLFALVDVDLLDPTVVILDWLQENGEPGDLLYFDEAFDPWNEGLALREAIERGLALRAVGHTGSALLVELV